MDPTILSFHNTCTSSAVPASHLLARFHPHHGQGFMLIVFKCGAGNSDRSFIQGSDRGIHPCAHRQHRHQLRCEPPSNPPPSLHIRTCCTSDPAFSCGSSLTMLLLANIITSHIILTSQSDAYQLRIQPTAPNR